MRISCAILALAGLALTGPLFASDDRRFEARWASLTAGGYEPLTIPLDWYDTKTAVPGGNGEVVSMTPEAGGVSPAALAAAAAWAQAQNSTALIVARDGRVVFERYWQGSGRDTQFNPQSMSKTVLALLVGTAVARGEIGSVDEPLSRYVSKWRGDPRGTIPLKALVHMAAGLEQGDRGFSSRVSADNPVVRHSLDSDFTRLPLSLARTGAPDIVFDYNNLVNQLLGIVLERASGKRYPALLSERLWVPLGLADAAMPLDRPGGMAMTSCCIFSRPVDWVRIGQLIIDSGSYSGKQLMPDTWFRAMEEPSPGYRGYGFQLWLGDQKVGGSPEPRPGLIPWQSERFAAQGLLFLNGHGGQRVYVMPDKHLVVVRAARAWPDAWDDAVLPNTIWRGTRP